PWSTANSHPAALFQVADEAALPDTPCFRSPFPDAPCPAHGVRWHVKLVVTGKRSDTKSAWRFIAHSIADPFRATDAHTNSQPKSITESDAKFITSPQSHADADPESHVNSNPNAKSDANAGSRAFSRQSSTRDRGYHAEPVVRSPVRHVSRRERNSTW